MDEDFEEWRAWFDSHKEKDGTINLSKHPHLVKYLNHTLGLKPKRINVKDLKNLGDTVSFEFSKGIKHG